MVFYVRNILCSPTSFQPRLAVGIELTIPIQDSLPMPIRRAGDIYAVEDVTIEPIHLVTWFGSKFLFPMARHSSSQWWPNTSSHLIPRLSPAIAEKLFCLIILARASYH